MVRLRSSVLILLLATSALRGQSSAKDQARAADLNFVANQLPQLHVSFFANLDPAVFQQAVGQLTSQISTATDAEFTVGLAQLVAMSGDPHSYLYLNTGPVVSAGFRQFPLAFRWLDDGIFVTAAGPAYSQALGMQLVRVGDLPIDDAVAKLATVIPTYSKQWLHQVAAQYLSGQQILQALHIVPATATTSLTFRDRAGKELTLDVGPQGAASVAAPDPASGLIPLYLQNTGRNYWYRYLPSLRTMYFKYNVCRDDPSNPFQSFSDQVWSAFDSNPVDTLVVDFRGNGGGSDSVIYPFYMGILERAPQMLANPNFRIYSVIDKGTFSSGVIDAAGLGQPLVDFIAGTYPGMDFSGVIRIIGEATGGALGGPGEVVPFTLPGSKFLGQYSTKIIELPPPFLPGLIPSVPPDIPVTVRSTDYFSRHDPVMAAILARSTKPADAPSGDVITVNAASFRAEQGLAPGSLAAGFGSFPVTPDAVMVNGAAAQMINATATQVGFLVPDSAAVGPAKISVQAAGQEIAQGQVTLTPTGPAIFSAQPVDPAQPGTVLNEDSSPNATDNRAARGSVIQIYATGHGPLDASGNAAAQVVVGSAAADVLFSGPAPGSPGLWQINARLPDGGTGQLPVFVIAGNLASNGVTIWVK